MIVEHAEQITNLALAPRPLHKIMAIWVSTLFGQESINTVYGNTVYGLLDSYKLG